MARELEAVAERLHGALAAHVPAVMKFSARLKRMEKTQNLSWQELCDRADELLKPALRLSTEVSHAYAAIVQQMTHLTTFAELRIDPLTGVCNRRSFDDSLQTFITQHERSGETFAMAMIDIDHFKKVNDERGHLHGDRVLQELAQYMRACVRPSDVVSRYGGEEFVLLMPRTDLATACNLCERTRAAVAANLSVTVSMGLAASLPADTRDTLLARADAALYLAKGEGRTASTSTKGCRPASWASTWPTRRASRQPKSRARPRRHSQSSAAASTKISTPAVAAKPPKAGAASPLGPAALLARQWKAVANGRPLFNLPLWPYGLRGSAAWIA